MMENLTQKIHFDFNTLQIVLQKIAFIDGFRGKWEAIEQKEHRYLKHLRRMATLESVGSSTRIEGVKLTDEEIEKLLKNLKITQLKTRDEKEVVGYFEVLDLILENASSIELSENYIKQLHRLLLRHSQKDERHRGDYKNLSNQVVANLPDGTQKIVFNTTAPHLVSKEMQELVAWTEENFTNQKLHPLLIVAMFVYEFLSIHPFQDGNGRLSRLLTTLLLIRRQYDFVQYVSFENIIEKRKANYYRALMNGQQYRYSDKEIIKDWILFFLDCLEELTRSLETKYQLFSTNQGYLNERQKMIKLVFEENKSLKISDLANLLTQFSINTLKKDLQYLVTEGVLEKIGKGKATIYIVKKEEKV